MYHCTLGILTRSTEAWQLVTFWAERMEVLVDREHEHDNSAPVVIWVGKTANLARKWLAEQSVIETCTGSHAQFAMPWFRVVSNDRFVSVEGAVHPSAHLQGGNHPPLHRLFQETYACLEAL